MLLLSAHFLFLMVLQGLQPMAGQIPIKFLIHAPFIGHGFPLVYVSLMTFVLIISSVTMVLAVHEGHNMNKKGVVKYLILTNIGGLIFLGSQAWEWTHLIS